jgi:deoxyribodipyrimidine photo-lyase
MILFIFRRDFRLNDNLGMIEAIKYAKETKQLVLPAFCIDKKQVNGNYFSNRAFQFLVECLEDLNVNLKNNLLIYEGDNILEYLKKKNKIITKVFSNKDYTPYAKKRDAQLLELCKKQNIECVFVEDYTLLSLDNNKVLTSNGGIYTVFTPYYQKVISMDIPKPSKTIISMKDVYKLKKDERMNMKKLSKYYIETNTNLLFGGRQKALELLENFNFRTYKQFRNFPYKKANSFLSAYIKFGCISIREIYQKAKSSNEFKKQLIWREFYAYLTFHFPHVLEGMTSNNQNGNFRGSTNGKISWQNDKKVFRLWCEGKTGFPIVDAGMRELNETGFIHNRVRMITAMFLTKHLHIDWRWGEQYFATKLIDYDPSSNNGGWQWCSGTGIDMRNYYRMFNPWTQTLRFDISCKYIKTRIPELKKVPAHDILKWDETHSKYKNIYLSPIVNHEFQRNTTLNEIYTKL